MTNQEEFALREEIKKLKNALLGFIGWSLGGTCNDCVPFREAPACIEFEHHKDCSYIKTLNEALALLGRPLEPGHDRDDAEADMLRMAQERADAIHARNILKDSSLKGSNEPR